MIFHTFVLAAVFSRVEGSTTSVPIVQHETKSPKDGGGIGPVVSNNGVNTQTSSTEKTLDERFANYIEKVRFLEAQNRKLASELETLFTNQMKKNTAIKQMYETELATTRKLIDDLSKDKASLEIKLNTRSEQHNSIIRELDVAKNHSQADRDMIKKLNQQIANLQSEVNMLRRSIDSLETERLRDKTTINTLQQQVDKLRIDFGNENLAHLDAVNRLQTLQEDMAFKKKVHEQELKELAALAYRDTTAENREFWKTELAQAIRDIQLEYDSSRNFIQGFCNRTIDQLEKDHAITTTQLNMDISTLKTQVKTLENAKLSLEDEIIAYKQLEGQKTGPQTGPV